MKIELTKKLLQQKYWDEGKSLSDIAKETGWSAVTIRNKILSFSILTRSVSESDRKSKKFIIPLKEELEELYWQQEKSIQQVANHYNVSTMMIQKWFKHHDIKKRDLPTSIKLIKNRTISRDDFKNAINSGICMREAMQKFKCGEHLLRNYEKEYDLYFKERSDFLKKRFAFHIPPKKELENYYIVLHYTVKKIAEIYNVSDSLVCQWLKKVNIEARYDSITSQAERDINEFLTFYGIS